MRPIIELRHVYKEYVHTGGQQTALHDVCLDLAQGQFSALVGPSGNGKTTLLNLITGLDRPSRGHIHVEGKALAGLSQRQLTRWRCAHVGIIFQFFQLLPTLTLWQNVVLPMDFLGRLSQRERRARALALLDSVGLADVATRLPAEVSGGQQQRAAIARALANNPGLLVADEPTGNLDCASAEAILQLFLALRDEGKTVLMVTHNEALAQAADRRVEIRAGRIFADSGIAS
ncbi:MAG: ABC transporter ATP-binding protein [Methylococcales bacterium]|nr:ABC transporter ATP-binding protein [Methylococcales bacterium]